MRSPDPGFIEKICEIRIARLLSSRRDRYERALAAMENRMKQKA